MAKKSGRYKPGARAAARSVKQDNLKWQRKLQEDKRAAQEVDKSAEEKSAVEKSMAEAVKAEKIMGEKCKLAEKKIEENEKKTEEVKNRAAQAVEKTTAEKMVLLRKVEDEEEAYKKCEARRLLADKQLQVALTDNEALLIENSCLKKRLSKLAPAAPPSWVA
ncbi:unnamed protein product [Polarella glacialis]|uniref:Uncharacterized protein n=1 Tax=Polarella glacialis TaxID=89957 RepID=A0A813L6K1_POLGL|nr:unnamed protein product [Polarella glacialis]